MSHPLRFARSGYEKCGSAYEEIGPLCGEVSRTNRGIGARHSRRARCDLPNHNAEPEAIVYVPTSASGRPFRVDPSRRPTNRAEDLTLPEEVITVSQANC